MSDRKEARTYVPDIRRLMPQDADAEKAVLSSWMREAPTVAIIARDRGVTGEWFCIPAHAILADVLQKMSDEGIAIDFVTVTDRLRKDGILQAAGGAATVTDISCFFVPASNVEYYLGIVEEKFTAREVIKACTDSCGRAYEQQGDLLELVGNLETKISAIALRRSKMRRKSVRAVVGDILQAIDAKDSAEIFGISTGFPNLDAIARGLKKGNMIVVSGDTGSGKTSLALNIAQAVAVRGVKVSGEIQKFTVLIFSLEMTTEEVTESLLQIGSGVNIGTIVEDTATQAEWAHFAAAATALSTSALYIRDETDLDILQMRSIARQIKPRLIVFDYAQLGKGSKSRYDRADLEIADISRNCKLMAGELDATILVISQTNDEGKMLGSRMLAKDANQVWRVEDTEDEKEKIVRVAKNRKGKTDTVPFRWIGSCQKFLPKAI